MNSTKKKILVADDDAAILDVMKMVLSSEYDVETVRDGSVISRIQEDPPDLVLMDVWMAHLDGRDICRALKQSFTTQDIPVLMISASHNVGRSTKAAGADDFIEKPFDIDVLLNKISDLTATSSGPS